MNNENSGVTIFEYTISPSLFIFDDDEPVIIFKYRRRSNNISSDIADQIDIPPATLEATFKFMEDHVEMINYKTIDIWNCELSYNVQYPDLNKQYDIPSALTLMIDGEISSIKRVLENKLRDKFGVIEIVNVDRNSDSRRRFIANTVIYLMTIKEISVDTLGVDRFFNADNHIKNISDIGGELIRYISRSRKSDPTHIFGPMNEKNLKIEHLATQEIIMHSIREFTRWIIYAATKLERLAVNIEFGVRVGAVTLPYHAYIEIPRDGTPQQFILDTYYLLLDYTIESSKDVKWQYPGNSIEEICETYDIDFSVARHSITEYILGFFTKLKLDISNETLEVYEDDVEYSGIIQVKSTRNTHSVPIGIFINSFSIKSIGDPVEALLDKIDGGNENI